MYTKINRITHDSYGNEYSVATIINTDQITSVKEMQRDPTALYDSEGNVAKYEDPTEPNRYELWQTTGPRIVLDQENYETLLKLLVK